MPDSFYRNPPEELSQGDIVARIPWGLIETPITLCRPIDRTATSGKAFYSTADPWAGYKNSPLPWTKNPEILHAIGWQGIGVVLWHDCEIEKQYNQQRTNTNKAFAAIAPVLTIDTLQTTTEEETRQLREAVKNGDHRAYFFLPAITIEGLSLPDSYVNLRFIWSIRQTNLLDRRLSLNTDILPSLYSQIFVFFTRSKLNVDPTCQNCGDRVPLVSVGERD